jgi:hypothetical protein
MQRITNMIKPSILRKGKYQSKLTDDDDSYEIPLVKQSQGAVSRRGSFKLTKTDSSRSITSQDPTLQSSISTFNSSISSISSVPYHYDDPLSGNESFSSLKHIEDLKPRQSRAVQDDEQVQVRKPRRLSLSNKRSPKPQAVPSTVQDDKQVQVRKPRRLSLSNKRSPKPQAVPSTNVPKTNPRRSRTVQAEQEVPRLIKSRSLSSKRAPRVQRCSSSRHVTDSKANVAPKVQRSSSSRRITDSKANVAPRKSLGSLDDFMNQYDEIMVEFPDARLQEHTDYGGSKSVTGW